MLKYLVVLALGVGAGYHLGFKDARLHHTTIVSRVIDGVGGSNRENYRNDIDKQMARQEK